MKKTYLALAFFITSYLLAGDVYGEEYKSSWACMTKKFFEYEAYMGNRVDLYDPIQFFLTIKGDSISYTSTRASMPDMTNGTLKLDKPMPDFMQKSTSAPFGVAYDEYSLMSFGGLLSNVGKSNDPMFFTWVFVFQRDAGSTTYTLIGKCDEVNIPK